MPKEQTTLRELVSVALKNARKRWPDLQVDALDFTAALEPELVENAARAMPNVADLYLARGCAQGDSNAQRAFLELYDARIRSIVERTIGSTSHSEDLAQEVTVAMMCRDDRPIELGAYRPITTLERWVRMVTARRAVDALRRSVHARPPVVSPTELLGISQDPERGYLESSMLPHFRRAATFAIARLQPDERKLLGYYVRSTGMAALATMLGLHRTTVLRRLARVRAELLRETYRELRRDPGLTTAEIDSLVRGMNTRLSVSLPD